MSRKPMILAAAALVILAGVAVSFWLLRGRGHPEPVAEAGAVVDPAMQAAYDAMSEAEREKVKTGLQTLVEGLKDLGLRPAPKIEQVLGEAVATGDPGEIRRAFHSAAYGRFASMEASGSAMEKFLEAEDPYVRLTAAYFLLLTGERSGVPALINLIGNEDALPHHFLSEQFDLREIAASHLAKYRVHEAEDALLDYYRRTDSGAALLGLVRLGVDPGLGDRPYRASAAAHYGKLGIGKFVPELETTVEEVPNSRTRVAEVWALARLTGDERYVDMLIDMASPDSERDLAALRDTLRFLGSIQSPKAVTALEEALDWEDESLRTTAIVNLLYNQTPVSEKARARLMAQLDHESRVVSPTRAMQIIAGLDDEGLRAHALRRNSSAHQWNYWGVTRAKWPVEEWIWNYVVHPEGW